jgi:hypothetical protein
MANVGKKENWEGNEVSEVSGWATWAMSQTRAFH